MTPASQDLARTFPSNAWMATAEGQATLRRVLLAFSVQNPRIGYCQSMNFLAAMLLMALDQAEERAFWVLVCLIDDGGVSHCDLGSLCGKARHVNPSQEGQGRVLLRTYVHQRQRRSAPTWCP